MFIRRISIWRRLVAWVRWTARNIWTGRLDRRPSILKGRLYSRSYMRRLYRSTLRVIDREVNDRRRRGKPVAELLNGRRVQVARRRAELLPIEVEG